VHFERITQVCAPSCASLLVVKASFITVCSHALCCYGLLGMLARIDASFPRYICFFS
jgi:hypothetical protein